MNVSMQQLEIKVTGSARKCLLDAKLYEYNQRTKRTVIFFFLQNRTGCGSSITIGGECGSFKSGV